MPSSPDNAQRHLADASMTFADFEHDDRSLFSKYCSWFLALWLLIHFNLVQPWHFPRRGKKNLGTPSV